MMRTWILVVALGACSGSGKGADTRTSSSSGGDTGQPGTSGTTGAPADAAPLTGVGIALDVTPREATVTIDDIAMGRANQLDPVVALAPGLHTLVVEHAGHKAYRAEFSVTDKVETFKVVLEGK
jgi:hypothetical protein